MRLRMGLLCAAALGMVISVVGGWSPVARAEVDDCRAPDRIAATVLVRSGVGDRFRGVEGDGGNPYIEPRSANVVVPMRALMEALEPGVDNVRWDQATHTASFWFAGHTLSVTFPPGVDRVYSGRLDGRPYGVTAFVCNGRTWLPLRGVSTAYRIELTQYPGNIFILDPAGNANGGKQNANAKPIAHRSLTTASLRARTMLAYLLPQ